jgi:uncharacterized membrane protein
MKPAKVVQFQVWTDAIYVLDENGSIWKNENFQDPKGWRVVPVPTHLQHDIEDAAMVERERVYDISEKLEPAKKISLPYAKSYREMEK